MSMESAVAILIVGSYGLLYFVFKELTGELSFLKALGYVFGLWMAVSGLNVGIALQGGVTATITSAIDIHYWGYTYFAIAITLIALVFYITKSLKTMLGANKTKL